jgi:leader peptidase (prepilin peptidase)/N-methyltransferase
VDTVGFCILVSLLLLIAAIDFKTMFIPNWSILLIFLAGLIFAFFIQEASWLERVIGFFSAGGILLIIAVLSGGLGGGDVKLMAAVGFHLGWKLTLWSMFLASVIGGIIGIGILASGKGKLKTEIPYVPILVIGIISSVLFGETMIRWYLSLFLK